MKFHTTIADFSGIIWRQVREMEGIIAIRVAEYACILEFKNAVFFWGEEAFTRGIHNEP